MTLLDIVDLEVGYGQTQVLFDVSLAINEGEIVALIGANGAGKTTTLRSIAGLNPAWDGTVTFRGEQIQDKEAEEIAKQGLILCPERQALFPRMSVIDNLRVGSTLLEDESLEQQQLDEVFDLFPRLQERSDQRADTLSGGEAQMLAIGKSLMGNPDILMLDEPSLGLAPQLVTNILDITEKLNEQEGVTIVLVEQNAEKALEIADRGYVIQTGEIALEGEAESLRNTEGVREAYLGL